MAIRMLATDLDGTLMSADHLTITARTKQALLEAHRQGVQLAIATGRTLDFIDHVLSQVPFVDYVIYSNGASVYDCVKQKDIYTNHILPDCVQRILKYLQDMPVYYNLYFDGGMYVQEDRLQHYENNGLPQAFIDRFMEKAHLCADMTKTAMGKSAESIAVYSLTPQQEKELTSFLQQEGLEVVSSLPQELEGTAHHADKGTALQNLCRLLHIPAQQTMSFGDAGNDCSMLAFACYSFAMGNGEPICKKIAKYTTAPNTEDGVAQAIETYVLKQK